MRCQRLLKMVGLCWGIYPFWKCADLGMKFLAGNSLSSFLNFQICLLMIMGHIVVLCTIITFVLMRMFSFLHHLMSSKITIHDFADITHFCCKVHGCVSDPSSIVLSQSGWDLLMMRPLLAPTCVSDTRSSFMEPPVIKLSSCPLWPPGSPKP